MITYFSTDKLGTHHWTPKWFFYTGFIILKKEEKWMITHGVHKSCSGDVLYRTGLWRRSHKYAAGTSAVAWAVSQPVRTPRPQQNVAMHCCVGTFFSHNKLFAYQQPPPPTPPQIIWGKSAEDGVWLPMWQGTKIKMVTQAILSPHGKH